MEQKSRQNSEFEEIKVISVDRPEDVLSVRPNTKLNHGYEANYEQYNQQNSNDIGKLNFTNSVLQGKLSTQGSMKRKMTIKDFEIQGVLGEGSFGKVYCAIDKHDQKFYAIKVLDKYHIMKHFTFQDDTNLYYAFEYANRGNLTKFIQKTNQNGKMPMNLARYYAAEILSALELMHSKSIIHRDLKPENILISDDWHLKIIDFGDSIKLEDSKQIYTKENKDPNKRKSTFVGTPLYVSPEMLIDNKSSPAGDLWALGCILFQMITGDVPFKAHHDYQTFQLILERKMTFPEDMDYNTKDFIDKLLQLDPSIRIGMPFVEDTKKCFEVIRNHDFFNDFDFKQLSKQPVPIPEQLQVLFDKPGTMKKKKKNAIDQEENLEEGKIEVKELKRGLIKKRNQYYMKQVRTFILTTEPKLSYYKDETEYRGQIPLTRQVYARRSGRDRFEVVTPQRTYFLFECQAGDSDQWIVQINQVISQYCKDQ
ncbi:3-phosphoinositide-dependent protein kinase 1 [Stylonychia lemnae]|uniref:non-specific serine/threonine protein kinase n=1 Tax=Stylonychia lemnae TaxID=5949 RepID=A0A078B066_STYLE|nr:3-phosphoinositide-dependent protein kinase 1 [Stylonychia lemnae]|eukprot:CDW87721.1 3-phosphoinositide-dependent protein kinase 1 [Stylonychia lemnae]